MLHPACHKILTGTVPTVHFTGNRPLSLLDRPQCQALDVLHRPSFQNDQQNPYYQTSLTYSQGSYYLWYMARHSSMYKSKAMVVCHAFARALSPAA